MHSEQLSFVACVTDHEVARRCLLASPCLAQGGPHQVILASGMPNAGAGFSWGAALARNQWLVMVHQDVFLPAGWDDAFLHVLNAELSADPALAVVGVYGVQAGGEHVGHVLDRGRWLGGTFEGAARVAALDELLVAVRIDSGLIVDPLFGWHLFATDLCLQARALGLASAVVCVPCEHHSGLPIDPVAATGEARQSVERVARAFNASAQVLIAKWPNDLPVHTPVAEIGHGFELVLPTFVA